MRSSWNPATGRHLLLAARRHHRQVIGSDVDTDSNEHSDKAEPEAPIMMYTPPIRSLTIAVAMMTLAVGMQVFGVIHHARLQVKPSKLVVRQQRKRKSRAVVLPAGHALT
jgi:hypothetical protein